MASSSFLYSAASALTSSVGSDSVTSVTSTHNAAPGPARSGADVGPALAAHDGGGAAAGHASDLQNRRDHAVGRVPVFEPGCDQQLPRFTGLSSVDRRASGVVERDRHHHSGQHDRCR